MAEAEVGMIRRIVRRSLAELWLRRDPIGYFRSKGFQIGDGCRLVSSTYGMLGTEPSLVILGNRVVVSTEVLFITHDGGVSVLRNHVGPMDVFGQIHIRDGAFIGARAVLLPGITIGRNSVVGAGSIVTRSVPDDVVVAGCPARIVSTTTQYCERLRPYFHPTCGMAMGAKHEYLRKLDRSRLIQRGWMSLPDETDEGDQRAPR